MGFAKSIIGSCIIDPAFNMGFAKSIIGRG